MVAEVFKEFDRICHERDMAKTRVCMLERELVALQETIISLTERVNELAAELARRAEKVEP